MFGGNWIDYANTNSGWNQTPTSVDYFATHVISDLKTHKARNSYQRDSLARQKSQIGYNKPSSVSSFTRYPTRRSGRF